MVSSNYGGYGPSPYNYGGPPPGRQQYSRPEAGSMDEFKMNLHHSTGSASSVYKETLAMLDQAKTEKKSSEKKSSDGGGGFLGGIFKPITDLFGGLFG